MTKVFVYGTLKSGYRNSHYLATSQIVGTGQTVAACRLFDVGFPVLRRRSDEQGPHNAPVRGEVYECDAAAVAGMDQLETEGLMYHRRTKLIRLDSGRVVKAQVYVGDAGYWRCRGDRLTSKNNLHDWHPRGLQAAAE